MDQQQRMDQPPATLSTKDLYYLKDAMSWELLAMKKCNFYSQQCQSVKMKELLDNAGRKHQQHYEMLLSHVNQNKVYQSQ